MALDTGAVFPLSTAYRVLDNHSTPTGVFGNPLFHFDLSREYSQSVLWESWLISMRDSSHLGKDLDKIDFHDGNRRPGYMSIIPLMNAPFLDDTVV